MPTLYIFDFDDTLALTDSHVIVNAADGSQERLDSRAFASYRHQPGDILDFSEFTRAEGSLIQSVATDMESAIQHAGIENVFIVTARSLGGPVREYLQEMDVTTPEIIATAGSEGKATWLTRQLAVNKYTEVKVYEDCRKNIKMLKEIVDAYNEEIKTNIEYSAVCIMPDGSMEIFERFIIREIINQTIKNVLDTKETTMKITKRQIKKLIREEKAKLLKEALEQVDYDNPNQSWGANDQDNQEEFQGSMMDLDHHNRIVAQIDRIIINFTKMGYTREDVMYALKGILEEI